MKKLLSLLLVLSMVFALAACGGTESGSGADDSAANMPVYRVVTEATFPPFDTVDEEGNIIGFDMDLIAAIGEDQGFGVEFIDMEFDSLIPALQADNGDIIAAGMNSEDPHRQAKVDFSTPYYDNALTVAVKEDNTSISCEDDLTSDMKVASQIGTTGADECLRLQEEGLIAEAVIQNGFDTCVLMLINGDVDAVIIDLPVAEAYCKRQPGKIKVVGEPMNSEKPGFAVQKGNAELLQQINTGLQNMIDNGTYDALIEKWFN